MTKVESQGGGNNDKTLEEDYGLPAHVDKDDEWSDGDELSIAQEEYVAGGHHGHVPRERRRELCVN